MWEVSLLPWLNFRWTPRDAEAGQLAGLSLLFAGRVLLLRLGYYFVVFMNFDLESIELYQLPCRSKLRREDSVLAWR